MQRFSYRADDFHERMDRYLDSRWDLPPEVMRLDRNARRVSYDLHRSHTFPRVYDDWNDVLNTLDLMKRVLAGYRVNVPRAHTGSRGGGVDPMSTNTTATTRTIATTIPIRNRIPITITTATSRTRQPGEQHPSYEPAGHWSTAARRIVPSSLSQDSRHLAIGFPEIRGIEGSLPTPGNRDSPRSAGPVHWAEADCELRERALDCSLEQWE